MGYYYTTVAAPRGALGTVPPPQLRTVCKTWFRTRVSKDTSTALCLIDIYNKMDLY